MTSSVKLGAFALLLVLVFGASFAVGRSVDPVEPEPAVEVPAPDGHDMEETG